MTIGDLKYADMFLFFHLEQCKIGIVHKVNRFVHVVLEDGTQLRYMLNRGPKIFFLENLGEVGTNPLHTMKRRMSKLFELSWIEI
jgi:hypothetical protein